jgi:hypothetical protein
MFDTDIQNVGRKSDSVGWDRHFLMVFGNMTKRAEMAALKERNSITSKMKTMSPRAVKPLNWCGV